jgi:diguanylate cyclase (GGDEF)-like protein/PAS domain S-box-containing protein
MNFLDTRTVVFSQLITDILCTSVLTSLWLQNRKRYHGMVLWVVDFIFQTTAILLIILRGGIPDWLSVGLSSIFVMAGAYSGCLGLERFIEKRSSQVYNLVLLGVFILIHFYFVFVHSSLEARDLNVSLGLLVVCFQCAWLMLHRAGSGLTRMTAGVGWVFALFCVVSLIRVFVFLVIPVQGNDFFKSGLYDTLILMSFQILLILLTFGLALMVNWRLLNQVKSQEEKFTKVFHSSPYAILITRPSDGLILDINRGFEELTGYLPSEAIGETTLNLHLWIKETDRQQVIAELAARGEVLGREFQFCTKSGKELTGLYYAETLNVEDEQLILSSISDITENKQAEMEIRKLAKFPDENPYPVLRLNEKGIILYANAGSQALLEEWKAVVGGEAPAFWRKKAAEVLIYQSKQTFEVSMGGRIISFVIVPVIETNYVNLYGEDITERKQAQDALLKSEAILREKSVRDHLTGVFNRRYMEETLDRELLRASRKQLSVGILMLDVDEFKRFNDTYGHAAGDAILVELGKLLLGHVRGEDIPCRYGGDEFIIVMPDASRGIMLERAESLRELNRKILIKFEGKILPAVAISIGVAVFPEDGNTSEAVVKAADEALYRAKREGPGQVIAAK